MVPLPQGVEESEAQALGVLETLEQALKVPSLLVEGERLGEEVPLGVRAAVRERAAVAVVERLPEGVTEALPAGGVGVAQELSEALSVLDAEEQALAEGQGEGLSEALGLRLALGETVTLRDSLALAL